ncbi:tyrosine-type recombinase/integrase [Variovorax sp. HJSM1_2]|uniref:tyrosine-type recombinase/integrase n=1 Tax=Variovorax sp. HJSM1_2 TaxID=3366263 RepID=UPI003BE49E06
MLTESEVLRRERGVFENNLQLNNREKLKSDARGLVMEGNRPLQLVREASVHWLYLQQQPMRADVSNTAWHGALTRAGIEDLRFHDLRHTWASWHCQAGTYCDELKDLRDGSPKRWWTATPNLRPKTFCQRQCGSSAKSKGVMWWSCHVFVTAGKQKAPYLRTGLCNFWLPVTDSLRTKRLEIPRPKVWPGVLRLAA